MLKFSIKYFFIKFAQIYLSATSGKVSKYGVFSGSYLPIFSQNIWKYGPKKKKLRIWTLFTPYADLLTSEGILDGKLYRKNYFSWVEGWYLKIIVFMKLRIAEENQCDSCFTLSKKCSYLELFLSVFSRIRTEYGEIRSIQYWKYGPE